MKESADTAASQHVFWCHQICIDFSSYIPLAEVSYSRQHSMSSIICRNGYRRQNAEVEA